MNKANTWIIFGKNTYPQESPYDHSFKTLDIYKEMIGNIRQFYEWIQPHNIVNQEKVDNYLNNKDNKHTRVYQILKKIKDHNYLKNKNLPDSTNDIKRLNEMNEICNEYVFTEK